MIHNVDGHIFVSGVVAICSLADTCDNTSRQEEFNLDLVIYIIIYKRYISDT